LYMFLFVRNITNLNPNFSANWKLYFVRCSGHFTVARAPDVCSFGA
jgi:hypothetical protein